MTGIARFAFFDADETLLRMKSMLDFIEFHWTLKHAERGPIMTQKLRELLKQKAQMGVPRDVLNRQFYRLIRGEDVAEVQAHARAWYESRWKNNPERFVTEGLSALRQCQEEGFRCVLVSGSFAPILTVFQDELGCDAILCTMLEIKDARYTGNLSGPCMIGEGKAEAIRNFLAAHNASPAHCRAYGDSESDIPMLLAVGEAHAIAPDPYLRDFASSRGWPIHGSQIFAGYNL